MRGGFFQEVDVVLVDLIRLVGLMGKQGKGILESSRLNQLSDYEDILLPGDKKWPFLLRFPIGCFGICLRSREYLKMCVLVAKPTYGVHLQQVQLPSFST